jgi:hypothetical protein
VNKQSIIGEHLAQGALVMKERLPTTSVTLALALPTLLLAETATTSATDPASQTRATDLPGFSGKRERNVAVMMDQ